MSPPIRVVIADDHPMFRYGLRAVLDAAEEVAVVGEATDGQQLLTVVDQTRPDVVLTDLAMPGLDGATATRRLLDRHPQLGGAGPDHARRRPGAVRRAARRGAWVPAQGRRQGRDPPRCAGRRRR
jgi:CheY-like chemotaxis protein